MSFTKGNQLHKLRKNFSSGKYWLGRKRPEISGEKHYLHGVGHTQETKDKISKVIKDEYKTNQKMGYKEGHKFYPGTKLFVKGHKPWNKGLAKKQREFESYPKIFSDEKFRTKIKERDNYTCLGCGFTEEEHLIVYGKGLSLHHIDYVKENCIEENLVTVCQQCNSRANFNHSYWIEWYTHFVPIVLNRDLTTYRFLNSSLGFRSK